jgi:hypothetical protein
VTARSRDGKAQGGTVAATMGKLPADSQENWREAAATELAANFRDLGWPLPDIPFVIGFPPRGSAGRRVDDCWIPSRSGWRELRNIHSLRPNPVDMLGVLTHKLLHAALPEDAGYGKSFREGALALGLEEPM